MENKKYKVGYTTGVFDMFHVGHLNILKCAKGQCDYLVVGVTTDKLCEQRKGKTPIISEKERVEILEAIKYVDKVVLQENMDKVHAVNKYQADAVFVGSDWMHTDSWNRYELELAEIGCDVVYIEYTQGISSSILRERINNI